MTKETKKQSLKQVALSESTNDKLDAISRQWKSHEYFCFRKKDIVAMLIDKLHKKEIKK